MRETRFSAGSIRAAFSGTVVLAVCGAILAGCGGVSNPFGERDIILPGERKAVVLTSADDDNAGSESLAVSVPGPVANANWAEPGGFATNSTGHLAYSGGGNRAWRTSVASVGRKGRPPSAGPIVYEGRIYILDSQARVSALNASSGGRAWQASLKPEKEGRHGATGGGVAAENGVIYAATGFGTVAALNAGSGQVIWQKNLEAPAHSAPTVKDGTLFVVTSDNVVYGIKAADGTEMWTYRGIPETAGFLSSAAPAVANGKVVVPFTSGEVMAYDATSGDALWVDALTRASRTSAVSSLNDISAKPVISDGVVYAVSVSGRMIAVSLSDGERLWTRNVASAYTPVVAGDGIFVVTLDGTMAAYSRSDGSHRWSTPLPKEKREAWAGPVLAGGSLWAVSTRGRLVAVTPQNGTLTVTRDIGDSMSQSPIVAGGRMYVLSNRGNLIALN